MPVLKTNWIGGSYEAACGGDTEVTSVRTSTLVMAFLENHPGVSASTICDHLGLTSRAGKRALERLRNAGKAYSILRSDGGHARNHWYVGPAPKTVNHVKARNATR